MNLDLGRDYVSPHKMPNPHDRSYFSRTPPRHFAWFDARERYAESEPGEEGAVIRARAMAEMLEAVTADNPPVSPIPLYRPAEAEAERSRARIACAALVFTGIVFLIYGVCYALTLALLPARMGA